MSNFVMELVYENDKMKKVNDFMGRLDLGDPRMIKTERMTITNPKNHSKQFVAEKLKLAFETTGGKVHEINFIEAAPKPNATLSNLEGDLGSSHMQGTPKAQGHEADNLSAESAGKE